MVISNVIVDVTISRRSFVFGQSRAKVSAGFTNASQINNYATRYAESYRPHASRKNIKKITNLYQGPKLLNSLPHSIIRSNNIRTFKRLLKSYLINLQYTQ